jgi:hypothetical protein
VVGVDVKYHEWAKPELARPENRERYLQVAGRSGTFAPGAVAQLIGRSGLAVTWLEHLLALSMPQHPSGRWSWAGYVVVHPEDNSDIGEACAAYRRLLADDSTFRTVTLEQLVDGPHLPASSALRDRYLVPSL